MVEEEDEEDQYSHARAFSCALASKLAYESSEIIQWECREWGFERCDVVRYRNCKAYIASNPRMVLVVFAGTQPMNIRYIPLPLQLTPRTTNNSLSLSLSLSLSFARF